MVETNKNHKYRPVLAESGVVDVLFAVLTQPLVAHDYELQEAATIDGCLVLEPQLQQFAPDEVPDRRTARQRQKEIAASWTKKRR